MTLAEYLKSYREQQGISQKELAEIISVSPAKVSRMEAGESFRFVPGLRQKLEELNPKIDFSKVEIPRTNASDFNPYVRATVDKMNDYYHFRLQQMQRIAKQTTLEVHADAEKENSRRLSCCAKKISEQLTQLGYKTRPLESHSEENTFLAQGCGNKYWVIELFDDIYLHRPKPENEYSEDAIANLLFQTRELAYRTYSQSPTQINKYSIVINAEERYVFAVYKSLLTAQPYEMPFDFSILIYCAETQKLVYEYNVVHHYHGRGLFDLCVPDKAVGAQRDFLTWTTCLADNLEEARNSKIANYFSRPSLPSL